MVQKRLADELGKSELSIDDIVNNAPVVFTTVLPYLLSENADERAEALDILALSKRTTLIPIFAGFAFFDHDASVREMAVGRLGWFGADALPVLFRLLESQEPSIRCLSVLALDDTRSVHAVAALCKVLNDEDRDVRFETVVALSRFHQDPLVRESLGVSVTKEGDRMIVRLIEASLEGGHDAIVEVLRDGRPAE